MRNSFKLLLIVFVVAVVMSMVSQRPRAKAAVPWRADLPAAREEARKSNKLVFVEFSATWCGPCREMAASTWSDKSVAKELEGMVPVQIDIDSHPEVKSEYGIDGIPAYALLDASGNAIRSGVGYLGPEEFIEWLHQKTPTP